MLLRQNCKALALGSPMGGGSRGRDLRIDSEVNLLDDYPKILTLMSSTRKREVRKAVLRKFFDTIKELDFNEVPRRKGSRLEFVNFHTLRHTFATMAAMNGVAHLTLMRLMGHKTPGITLRYIEIADSLQEKMREKAMQDIFPPEFEFGRKTLPEDD